MRKSLIILTLLISGLSLLAQYSGPAAGSVESGVIVNTDNYTADAPISPPRFQLFNKFSPDLIPGADPVHRALVPEGSNVIFDPNYSDALEASSIDSVLKFQSFGGIAQTNSIPPDPYLAVGPDHIITVVNSSFRISDKQGNTLKTINADLWYNTTMNNPSAFDPKVIYDQFDQRWVMVWLHQNDNTSESYYLFSVSDDDDPLGTWFNWKLPSNTNGNTLSGNWGDYQGVGYDQNAVYLTSNQFTFGTNASYNYTKIRIVKKSDLYAAAPGKVNWQDLWNIRYPGTSDAAFGLRPVRMKSPASEYYFAVNSRYGINTTFGIYKLSNPLTNPVLTSVAVPVAPYRNSPDPQQLGGGSPNIDGGGFNLRNEPVYKDGILHLVHSVGFGLLSNVRYLAIDLSSNTAVVDFSMGTNQHYHTYPAVAVSQNDDVILTYSRSSAFEYMGAYYTILRSGSNMPLGSLLLQEGKGNYVKTFGGTRNRWGDYNGAYIDPLDGDNFWVSTEYVANTNTWGVWVAGVRTVPFPDPTLYASRESIDFEDIEVGFSSDNLSATLRNYGEQNIVISNISNGNSVFEIKSGLNFPITLAAYDSLVMELKFTPTTAKLETDSIVIASNNSITPTNYISLQGLGYVINSVSEGNLYAITNKTNPELITINPETAEATEIGVGNVPYLESITVYPMDDQLYAISPSTTFTDIARINADGGDAYVHFTNNIVFDAITFAQDNTLYGISDDRQIYTFSLPAGTPTPRATSGIKVKALTIDPVTGDAYATTDSTLSDDRIYKIDLSTGKETLIGSTGLGRNISALAFNSDGDLYGIVIKAFNRSYLLTIDKANATVTEIGQVNGYNGISGLAFSLDPPTSVQETAAVIPGEYSLEQNYPNPFNPATTIKFSLPVNALVNLTVYNILGESVAELINQDLSAGTHSVEWNTSGREASGISSGIYFYTIKASGSDGKEFVDTKKMILLK